MLFFWMQNTIRGCALKQFSLTTFGLRYLRTCLNTVATTLSPFWGPPES